MAFALGRRVNGFEFDLMLRLKLRGREELYLAHLRDHAIC
jgi:hypothetical protein